MSSGYRWKALQRAVALPPSEALIRAWQSGFPDLSREAIIERMEAEQSKFELWRNDLYQVEVRRYPDDGLVHLNIRRVDGWPGRDWRHFQFIKNELVGPECEGVEIYPAESRLVDTTNKYHLYCFTDPTYRIPFGYWERDVQDDQGETAGGLRQRPLMKARK
jgi:hypothetical protein